MLILNRHSTHNEPLDPRDAETLGVDAAAEVERYLSHRDNHAPTPLHALPALAAGLGIAALHVKDEGTRLGLGSFKALGGSYAVIRLVLEEAERQLGRAVDIAELHTPPVRAIASGMTFGCATDGNHGKSVAAGAQLVGAQSAIFVHAGVSDERVAAIARYGAEMIRVDGTYDDSIRESARVCAANGWTVVSDTSWPGYERIPGLVMQGYTAIVREALRALPQTPTHVFVQAGVGGVAAALAAYLSLVLGKKRPAFIVVEPARAACIFASAQAGEVVQIAHGEATVMAMLECYEPSPVAWRILSRAADAFMTVEEEGAVAAMNRLARPLGKDMAVVAGESGGAGLAGLLAVAEDRDLRKAIHLDAGSRVFIVNTEGATDPARYTQLVGLAPEMVLRAAS
ncbi:diaminopropionate ammonia-lyase [Phyllobacterium calauticae]|uniref:diaminopropionate ammonia-lyase n=1 Tax=Phyllobacterium calauticae TaxID=2817027 RepID=UPI001CBC3667|nr:diaminopropionate ammonia-lyase [Phyllobacterium calauticae]MBZ3691760.1 diaminopropionate ammonia-lyase [Phyllobacterium calauticae]